MGHTDARWVQSNNPSWNKGDQTAATTVHVKSEEVDQNLELDSAAYWCHEIIELLVFMHITQNVIAICAIKGCIF